MKIYQHSLSMNHEHPHSWVRVQHQGMDVVPQSRKGIKFTHYIKKGA